MMVGDSSAPSVVARISRRRVSSSRRKATTTGWPPRPVSSARQIWFSAITTRWPPRSSFLCAGSDTSGPKMAASALSRRTNGEPASTASTARPGDRSARRAACRRARKSASARRNGNSTCPAPLAASLALPLRRLRRDRAVGPTASRRARRRRRVPVTARPGGQLADGRGSRLPRGATSSRPSRRPSSPCRAPARGTEAPTRLPTDGSRRSRVRRRSWRAPRSPGARAPRTSRTVTTLRRLPPFCEKPPHHRLGRVVLALADVLVADDPLAIQEDRRGPGPNAPALPDRVLVVLYHRVPDPQLLRGVYHALVRLLPEELRAVHADDHESVLLVPFVPAPQLRDHVPAVDSAEGPELDQHDPAAQARRAQRPAVDPAFSRDLRRRRPETRGLAGG